MTGQKDVIAGQTDKVSTYSFLRFYKYILSSSVFETFLDSTNTLLKYINSTQVLLMSFLEIYALLIGT